MLLAAWLTSFAIFSSCAGGPRVTACVVDASSGGFQCVDYKKKETFIPFESGQSLGCSSPYETEAFMKACKEGKVIVVDVCSYNTGRFQCLAKSGDNYDLALSKADNYFCLSSHDKLRVIERCKKA